MLYGEAVGQFGRLVLLQIVVQSPAIASYATTQDGRMSSEYGTHLWNFLLEIE